MLRAEITGLILCGGAGSRMGGVNKPLAELAGVPLVQHVRERLALQVHSMVISANDQQHNYALWGDVVVTDSASPSIATQVNASAHGNAAAHDVEQYGGPLIGLYSVLPLVTTPYLFCCPGDAPMLDRTLVARLANALTGKREADVAVPFDGARTQHLFLLMRANEVVSHSLHQYLAHGGRSVHGWVSTMNCATANATDIADSFKNINTALDMAHVAAVIADSLNTHSLPERS